MKMASRKGQAIEAKLVDRPALRTLLSDYSSRNCFFPVVVITAPGSVLIARNAVPPPTITKSRWF